MVARPRHPKFPEVFAKDQMRELTSKLPPISPKMSPIIPIRRQSLIDSLVLEKTGHPEQEAFCGGSIFMKQFQIGPLGQDEERNLVEFVAKRDRERLKDCLIHTVSSGSTLKLIRLLLHSHVGSCFDEIVNCPGWQLFKGCTTATRVRNRRESSSVSSTSLRRWICGTSRLAVVRVKWLALPLWRNR